MKLDLTWLTVCIEVVMETLRSTESVLEMKRYVIVCHKRTFNVLLVPRNFSRGRGVIPSLTERGEQSCQHGYYQFGIQHLEVWSSNTTHYTPDHTSRCCIPNWQYPRWQDCAPRSARDGMTPLPWLTFQALTVCILYHYSILLFVFWYVNDVLYIYKIHYKFAIFWAA
jgi:hypothetical protein